MLALAAIAAASSLRSDTPRTEREVMLVYVGAQNCGPCLTWQRESEAAFLRSGECPGLTYREVKASTLFEILSDETWPADLRVHRARLDRTMGVPLWLVVVDGHVASQSFGLSAWTATVLPTLRSLLH